MCKGTLQFCCRAGLHFCSVIHPNQTQQISTLSLHNYFPVRGDRKRRDKLIHPNPKGQGKVCRAWPLPAWSHGGTLESRVQPHAASLPSGLWVPCLWVLSTLKVQDLLLTHGGQYHFLSKVWLLYPDKELVKHGSFGMPPPVCQRGGQP